MIGMRQPLAVHPALSTDEGDCTTHPAQTRESLRPHQRADIARRHSRVRPPSPCLVKAQYQAPGCKALCAVEDPAPPLRQIV